jgi:hypothetical protein
MTVPARSGLGVAFRCATSCQSHMTQGDRALPTLSLGELARAGGWAHWLYGVSQYVTDAGQRIKIATRMICRPTHGMAPQYSSELLIEGGAMRRK